jgi:hypothetical protein
MGIFGEFCKKFFAGTIKSYEKPLILTKEVKSKKKKRPKKKKK